MKAVLTGHTRGLGAALAANLLSRNIPVLGLARGKNNELAQRYTNALVQVELDLSDAASLAQWLDGNELRAFLADCKTVLLINNAGTVQPVGPLGTQDSVRISHAVTLNIAAPLMLANAVVESSAGASDRRILHISSGAGRSAYPGWSVYCSTKAAIDHHARAVVIDQLPGLRMCSLAPGIIDTDMQTEIRATPLDRFPLRERFEMLKRNGELISPQACAQHVVDYLLSDQFGREAVADLRMLGQ